MSVVHHPIGARVTFESDIIEPEADYKSGSKSKNAREASKKKRYSIKQETPSVNSSAKNKYKSEKKPAVKNGIRQSSKSGCTVVVVPKKTNQKIKVIKVKRSKIEKPKIDNEVVEEPIEKEEEKPKENEEEEEIAERQEVPLRDENGNIIPKKIKIPKVKSKKKDNKVYKWMLKPIPEYKRKPDYMPFGFDNVGRGKEPPQLKVLKLVNTAPGENSEVYQPNDDSDQVITNIALMNSNQAAGLNQGVIPISNIISGKVNDINGEGGSSKKRDIKINLVKVPDSHIHNEEVGLTEDTSNPISLIPKRNLKIKMNNPNYPPGKFTQPIMNSMDSDLDEVPSDDSSDFKTPADEEDFLSHLSESCGVHSDNPNNINGSSRHINRLPNSSDNEYMNHGSNNNIKRRNQVAKKKKNARPDPKRKVRSRANANIRGSASGDSSTSNAGNRKSRSKINHMKRGAKAVPDSRRRGFVNDQMDSIKMDRSDGVSSEPNSLHSELNESDTSMIAVSANNKKPKTFLFNTPLGEYETIKNLGQGSYGKVKLMRNTLTNVEYAVKIIKRYSASKHKQGHPSYNKAKTLDRRILREVNLSKILGEMHPHIISLYDFRMTDRNFYLFYEYINGPTLSERIGSNGVSEEEAKLLFKPIADAISYCHSYSIIHRDLKLENLLIDYTAGNKIESESSKA
ncbi:Serine/threonine protein kinase KIN1 [Smittium mucronatum]|uniref:Serine/threonine protein kinase KIN1 n=1 Tax=Smittium mucronatum TaxID=133383 RepID=A0A1R0GST2_9FUNG|nr:Serine/threonine protein kinase KIN1 [Smittium mucronatum]